MSSHEPEETVEADEAVEETSGDPSPLPAPPESGELEPWLRRLHESVSDLATRQEDFRRQLAVLVDVVDRLVDERSPTEVDVPPPSEDATEAVSPLTRLRRSVKQRVVGPAVARARALWREARHFAAPEPEPVDDAPPVLAEHDVTITARGPLPSGLVEAATHVLAVEGLRFLHLASPASRSGDADPWADFDLHLEQRALDVPDRPERPVGKAVWLFGDAEPAEAPSVPGKEDLVFTGPWAFDSKTRRPTRLPLALGDPPSTASRDSDAGASVARMTAIVLTRPLTGGLDRLVARVVRAERDAGRAVVIAQLAVEGPRPAHPALGFGLLPDPPAVWPLADLVPAGHRGAVLRQLLRRRFDAGRGPHRILHVGPGDGFFDTEDPSLRRLLEETQLVDLPLPRFPDGRLVERPAGTVDRRLVAPGLVVPEAIDPTEGDLVLPADPDAPPEPSPGSKAEARLRLGLDPELETLAWLGDLVPEERPEDLVALADRLRDEPVQVLLVGRGPLDATIDDLARFLRPPRLVRRSVAEPAEGLAAADRVVSSAESLPLPWWLEAARTAGLPVHRVAPGDVDALVEAVRGESPRESADEPAPDRVDVDWLDRLWG